MYKRQQSSHAAYYAYGTIYFTSYGVSSSAAGWLWAEGIVLEMAVFLLGAPLLRTGYRYQFLMLAAVAGVCRWGAVALWPSLPVFVATQWLHGVTFGVSHLTVMVLIREQVPEPQLAARAYSLHMAVSSSVVMGLATLGAAHAYRSTPQDAFLVMAALTVGGGMVAGGGQVYCSERRATGE